MYKLRDWVDETQLCETLSRNERAVEYLERHEHLIDDNWILYNVNAIDIIEKRIKYVNDYEYYYDYNSNINYNKNAVNFLRNHPQYIKYDKICGEEHGIEFVEELIKNNELDKINWCALSRNPAAMHILNDPKYYTYVDWRYIVENKNAVELIKNNLHMIEDWFNICKRPHLIDIIECNMDKLDWNALSINHNAIHILEQNIHNVNINYLCVNKNGFKLLLRLNHVFNNNNSYHKNIVFEYFDYCEKNNKSFNLIRHLSEYGYTENHMEFLQHNNYYQYLSANPNIFEYDYKRMRETRQALLWYNDIKK